ncbi:MAG: hypothetical protein J3Q66DRAFT_193274 [Benniella sp.]|nr:MAG: hypothetical protein J3Q66DRAFT_193274 [Benniella sp.]
MFYRSLCLLSSPVPMFRCCVYCLFPFIMLTSLRSLSHAHPLLSSHTYGPVIPTRTHTHTLSLLSSLSLALYCLLSGLFFSLIYASCSNCWRARALYLSSLVYQSKYFRSTTWFDPKKPRKNYGMR